MVPKLTVKLTVEQKGRLVRTRQTRDKLAAAASAINDAWSWEDTEEGEDYWSVVYMRIIAYVDAFDEYARKAGGHPAPPVNGRIADSPHLWAKNRRP